MSSISAVLVADTVNLIPSGNWLSAFAPETVIFPSSACVTEEVGNASPANNTSKVTKTNARTLASRAILR